MEFAPELLIPDWSLSIDEGAIAALGWQSVTDKGSYTRCMMEAVAQKFGFDLSTPFEDYPEEVRDIILHGTRGEKVEVHYVGQRGRGVYNVEFEGLIKNVERRYRETGSDTTKQEYETFMRITPCRECGGRRLKKESLAVTVGEKNIAELCVYSIRDLKQFVDELQLTQMQVKDWETDFERN